jgi:hypothetical protein
LSCVPASTPHFCLHIKGNMFLAHVSQTICLLPLLLLLIAAARLLAPRAAAA